MRKKGKNWTATSVIQKGLKFVNEDDRAALSGQTSASVPAVIRAVGRIPKKQTRNQYIGQIMLLLRGIDVQYVQEHHFARPKRQFRFDIAIVPLERKIAIEYEGIYSSEKSRHTTVSGYSEDTVKYNMAATLGWRVLRYTADNYTNVVSDVEKLIANE